jgi:hypothetical protein
MRENTGDDLDVDAKSAVVARLLHPTEASTVDEMHATQTDLDDDFIDKSDTRICVMAKVVRSGRGEISASCDLAHLDQLGWIA